MKCLMAGLLAIISLGLSPALVAEGDPVAGKNKSANCMGCHGVKGYFNVYPTYRVPKLGGQHPEYIVNCKEQVEGDRELSKTVRGEDSCLLVFFVVMRCVRK